MSINSSKLALFGNKPKYQFDHFPIDRVSLAKGGEEMLLECVQSGRWSMFTSEHIEKFENEFADYIGARHAILVNSCTTALMASLASIGVGNGCKVVVPAYTYIGTALPARMLGAKIEWVDIGQNTHGISPDSLREKLSEMKIDAILYPLLFGASDNFQEIIEISKSHSVPIVFDCAQFLGQQKVTKTMTEAGICCFSFGESKILRIGEGGAIATNSDELAERVRLFRHEGEAWLGERQSRVSLDVITPEDVLRNLASKSVGTNLRPSAMAAAIGRTQLSDIDAFLAATHHNAKVLRTELKNIASLNLPHDNNRIWWTFPILINDSEIDRDTLLAALLAEGIPVGVHFPRLLPDHPIFKSDEKTVELNFVNAKKFSEKHFVLPIYPRCNDRHMREIANCVRVVIESAEIRTKQAKENALTFLEKHTMTELSAGLYMFMNPS